ncbi:hypothetical protein Q1695_000062 [Nippostrongylus brasiliensis]|nr:hypothetical protein Q1695_000062 [Nippostrongylus brasiliensis]
MFSIRAGLNASIGLPKHAVILVGQNKLLKNVQFNGDLEDKFNGEVDEKKWNAAVKALPASGSIPLVFNQSKIISVPDTASRHNTPSNCHLIAKELKVFPITKDTQNLNIILYSDAENVLANVCAIARSFPVFTRKTESAYTANINVEVCLSDDSEVHEDDIKFLNVVSQSIRHACRLIDSPANEMTTDALVQEALAIAEDLGVKKLVISGEDLDRDGFGGIYSVGKAGPTPPAFVVLSHTPSSAKETYCLVGKGVVFDTGGMQIKSKTGMPNMKRDMGGAAGLLGAFRTLVSVGFEQNLHLCLCIVENNISPLANKPDDVIKMLSGKTVEINNTDAEGRLILADGVYYAKNVLKADVIIDMATLTGAQAHLSGKLHSALLTNSEEWEQMACDAGRRSGDLVAPMVFCPDLHFSDLKSPIADMRNSNLGKMEGPPSAVAGLFIGAHINFGEGLKWLHFDIAAPAESGDRATGYGPALLSYLLGHHTDVPMLKKMNKNCPEC